MGGPRADMRILRQTRSAPAGRSRRRRPRRPRRPPPRPSRCRRTLRCRPRRRSAGSRRPARRLRAAGGVGLQLAATGPEHTPTIPHDRELVSCSGGPVRCAACRPPATLNYTVIDGVLPQIAKGPTPPEPVLSAPAHGMKASWPVMPSQWHKELPSSGAKFNGPKRRVARTGRPGGVQPPPLRAARGVAAHRLGRRRGVRAARSKVVGEIVAGGRRAHAPLPRRLRRLQPRRFRGRQLLCRARALAALAGRPQALRMHDRVCMRALPVPARRRLARRDAAAPPWLHACRMAPMHVPMHVPCLPSHEGSRLAQEAAPS
jgi:hypothetical protein